MESFAVRGINGVTVVNLLNLPYIALKRIVLFNRFRYCGEVLNTVIVHLTLNGIVKSRVLFFKSNNAALNRLTGDVVGVSFDIGKHLVNRRGRLSIILILRSTCKFVGLIS